MASSDTLQEIKSLGTMPNYQQSFADLYNQPVIQPLVQERANLESQYLPNIFSAFGNMGTSASDLTPTAKLTALANSMGRLGGRIQANQGVQDFYGNQIQQLANMKQQQYLTQLQTLKDLYTSQLGSETSLAQLNFAKELMGMYGGNGGQMSWNDGMNQFNPTSTPLMASGFNQGVDNGGLTLNYMPRPYTGASDILQNIPTNMAAVANPLSILPSALMSNPYQQFAGMRQAQQMPFIENSPFLLDLARRFGDMANASSGLPTAPYAYGYGNTLR